MTQKTFAGLNLEVTDEGYLVDPSKWTEEIAKEIAKEENIELTEKHFQVLKYIRENADSGLTIRKIGKSGIVDIKGFYDLFPGGPLKMSTKIAGIKKPASCV
ncbi:MAG TPA: sulfur relay protein DsrC [Bacteroidales bacterium]|jgi:tRNA 2-thiouridine synthesizing protein E|nr:sulfur relay protein DsrC [Bacteroidales bacterium]